MARLKPCRDCGQQISGSASSCPHCGATGRKGLGCGGCLGVVLAGAVVVGIVSAIIVSAIISESGSQRDARWAHVPVNVRSGRSTSDSIVTGLEQGERVEVDSLVDGWFRVFRNGQPIGYSASSVLNEGPLPPPLAGPVCVPVVNPILIEELNATQAVRRTFDPSSPEALRLPERMRFTVGWIVASPTGGLWLSYMQADNSSPNGMIMPLNEQARTESTVGTAGPSDAPGYQGVTATDTEAVMALACAQR